VNGTPFYYWDEKAALLRDQIIEINKSLKRTKHKI